MLKAWWWLAAGEMTLTSLPGGLSRWEGMQAMLKADSGKIDDLQKLQSEKVVALVIEPIGTGDFPSAFIPICFPDHACLPWHLSEGSGVKEKGRHVTCDMGGL